MNANLPPRLQSPACDVGTPTGSSRIVSDRACRRYGMNRLHVIGRRVLLALVAMHSLLFTGPASLAQTLDAKPAKPMTSQEISLDLKGVDILDVLKLLSQKSGLNFVAGHNVSGRVTIFANDIDVWEAFERIIDANDLAYERQGTLISVMAARDYELLYGERFQERKRNAVIPLKFAKATQVATVLNQIKSTVGRVVIDEASNTVIINDPPSQLSYMRDVLAQLDQPTETRVLSLNYTEAEKLKEKVQEFLTPGVGTLSVDARTNKVVVTDLAGPLQKIEQVVRAFDEPDGEVLIEAKIVRVELTNDQSLGIDWQQVFAGIDSQVRGNFRVLSDIVGGTATGAALKLLTAPRTNTSVILEALKTYAMVESIANPRVTVSDNQEAKILVGTKEAFVTVTTTIPATGSVVTSPQIQFIDVGTKLFVTPHIKREGHVQLKIRPEVSTAKIEIFQTNRIPIVTTTEAETNVLVKSGVTLIIGGLIENKVEKTRNQLPIVGDLPVVGAAFRGSIEKIRKSELVVFLTPQIISPSGERLTEFPQEVKPATRTSESEGSSQPSLPLSYQTFIRTLVGKRLSQQLRILGLPAGSVDVRFVLAPNGRLVGHPHLTSPQGGSFIQAARTAIETIAFPPFPEGASSQEVRFRVAVDYTP